MTEQDRRQLIVKINEIMLKLEECVPEKYLGDKIQIMYYLRHANHLINDIRTMIDFKENPDKMTVEMTRKPKIEVISDATPVSHNP